MQWLKDNLDLLRRRQPKLAEQLANLPPSDRVSVEPARGGLLTATYETDDGKKHRLCSRYNPQREATRAIESLQLDPRQNQMHFGFGLGYSAQAILANLKSDHPKLIVCERYPEILHAALSYRDLRPLLSDSRVLLFVGPQTRGLFPQFWENVVAFMLNGLQLSDNQACASTAPEWYDEVREVVLDAIRACKVGLNTKFIDGRRFLDNTLCNAPLQAISRPIKPVLDLMRGKPVIIVAAGPSLDSNVEQLRGMQEQAFILCVDTAYRNLITRGIVPHLVVTIDARDNSLRHLQGIKEPTGALLAFDLEASHNSIRSFGGPRLAVGVTKSNLTIWLDSVLGGKGMIPKGSNVMLSAYHLAEEAGAEPIILIGCDLAYPREGGSTHAGQTAFAANFQQRERDGKRYILQPSVDDPKVWDELEVHMVEGVDGQPVPTIPQLYTYLSMLESLVAQGRSRVLNATEGGARIHGTETITLAEALARETQPGIVPPPGKLPLPPEPDNRAQLKHALSELEADLARCHRGALEGRQLCGRLADMLDRHDTNQAANLAAQLQPLFASLLKPETLECLIESGAPAQMFAFLQGAPRRGESDVTPQELLKDYSAAFDAVLDVTDHFREVLAEVLMAC
jgi:hypothetical protein